MADSFNDLWDEIEYHLSETVDLTPGVMARDARARAIVDALGNALDRVDASALQRGSYAGAAEACRALAVDATRAARLFGQLAARAEADPRWLAHRPGHQGTP
jgi:hypothetical protein